MRRNRRNLKTEENDYGAPAWMVTYGDMVTLVLTFFVLLYSFSSINLERFQEVMSAIQHSFMGRTGILMGPTEIGAAEGQRIDIAELTGEIEESLTEQEIALLEMMAELEETYEQVRVFLQKAGLEDDIMLHMEERGIVMELPERILFDTGRAEIKADFLPTWTCWPSFVRVAQPIIVEGHTDNVPIRTFLYPSNWELSVARAVSVTRYLVEEHNMDPERFLATGYGEYHPIADNETAEGRARNRRVSIVISIKQIKE